MDGKVSNVLYRTNRARRVKACLRITPTVAPPQARMIRRIQWIPRTRRMAMTLKPDRPARASTRLRSIPAVRVAPAALIVPTVPASLVTQAVLLDTQAPRMSTRRLRRTRPPRRPSARPSSPASWIRLECRASPISQPHPHGRVRQHIRDSLVSQRIRVSSVRLLVPLSVGSKMAGHNPADRSQVPPTVLPAPVRRVLRTDPPYRVA